LFESEVRRQQACQQELIRRPAGGENPYLLHQTLGEVMTKAATVVRRNPQLRDALREVEELAARAKRCALADTGQWTNQNLVFTRALLDMFPLAQTILRGALARDECRGAHYKPEFAMPHLTGETTAQRRAEADAWCTRFDENNRRWLKSTVAVWQPREESVQLSYEDVDTSLIPPRPRLYGLVGAALIEEVWNQRVTAQLARVP
jgi:succinate dehydrogenase / fumarate reductase flavoprotein subunit